MTTTPELLSLVVPLQWVEGPRGPAPRWWGRAAHALLLKVIAEHDPALAQRLHAPEAFQPRPFTASSLLGPGARTRLRGDAVYRLRFTAYAAEVAAVLQAARRQGLLAPGTTVTLAGHTFRVLSDPDEASPWQAATTYAALAAPWLTARQTPARRQTLLLASPTTFHIRTAHQPFPLPERVFGDLLRRWNAYAPVTLPVEVRRFAAEVVAVSRFHLSSRSVPLKDGALRIGAVGQVTYRALAYDRYWLSLLEVLAAFALFAGVGADTTLGLGQVRALTDEVRTTRTEEATAP